MLIVCPACASEYEIDAERVGPTGRSVRCAACRETWFLAPEAAAANPAAEDAFVAFDASAEAEPGPTIVDEPLARRPRPAAPKLRPPRFAKAFSPALALGLIAFVLLPLTLLGRSSVVRAMPQSAGVFARIGLPVNLRGVDLRDVVAFQTATEGDKPGQLVVEGDLVGAGRERVSVPDLAVEVRDEHEQILYRWTLPAPRAALEPAETARFRASLSAPPLKGRAVQVRFADAASAEATTSTDATPPDSAHSGPAHAADAVSPAHGAAHAH